MDKLDWESFFDSFPSLFLVVVSSVSEKNQYRIEKKEFMQGVESYIEALITKDQIDLTPYRKIFSVALSQSEEDFTLQVLQDTRVLVKQKQPMIQLRLASWIIDEQLQIKTKIIGKESIPWGVEIAYPQTFQDPDTKEIKNGLTDYPNGMLFKEIMRWIRKNTKPVQIIFESNEIQSNLRLGSNALQWIDHYKRLSNGHIKIKI